MEGVGVRGGGDELRLQEPLRKKIVFRTKQDFFRNFLGLNFFGTAILLIGKFTGP